MTNKDSLFIADELSRLTTKRYKIHNKFIYGYISNDEYTKRMDESLEDAKNLMIKDAEQKKNPS